MQWIAKQDTDYEISVDKTVPNQVQQKNICFLQGEKNTGGWSRRPDLNR
jgi:hypothetical protein